jgi:putative ABC transport system substrate-binding protein
MRRRQFITLLGGAVAAWPIAARAQQRDRTRRIGVLMNLAEDDPEARSTVPAFRQSLAALGWTVGRNIEIDFRYASDDPARFRAAAVELISLAPDVILGAGTASLRPLLQMTRTIPIVFTTVSEPVAEGFVQSLARPGGNATGFTGFEPTFGAKWLELLKEIAPGITRVWVMWNPDLVPQNTERYRSAEAASPRFAVEVLMAPVHGPAEIESVMATAGRQPGSGLIVQADALARAHRGLILALAARHRLPAIYPFRYFAAEGGLMSYGVDPRAEILQAATYVDRILRGEKPADLPVQQPTKFEMAVNLRTAKALGLAVPQTLLVAADEVIE